jgi:hypothetical protein
LICNNNFRPHPVQFSSLAQAARHLTSVSLSLSQTFMLASLLDAVKVPAPHEGTQQRSPRYAGEDTTPTSRREILGWYAYGIAAEVFAVCGVGS